MSDDVTLIESLRFAVPLWIVEIRNCAPGQRVARARRCSQVIAEQGDALQFKGKTTSGRQASATAFNSLAEGLACLAYEPGGVTFSALHWCVGSSHMGVGQDYNGPCEAEVERDRIEGRAPISSRGSRRATVDVHLPAEQPL